MTRKAYFISDTAYDRGAIALVTENGIVSSQILDEKLAHGKALPLAIKSMLQFCDDNSLVFSGIGVGLGPGSFIGVRIALATAQGASFARAVPISGFCSHRALFHSHVGEEKRASFFMKASGNLGYFSSVYVDKMQVISREELAMLLTDDDVLFTNQKNELAALSCRAIMHEIYGPTPPGIVCAFEEKLRSVGTFVDEADFIKPNYLKPANVSVSNRKLVSPAPDALTPAN